MSYFDKKELENKSIILKIASLIFKGLLTFTSVRIDKNPIGGGYRMVAFFKEKKEKKGE